MGRNRFVVPKVVRLNLSDGDWIDVKEHLTVGESRLVAQSFVGAIHEDGSRTLNMQLLGLGQALAYIVDWSFVDANDKRVPVTLDSIKALDVTTFREVDDALTAHINAVAGADQGKKTTTPGDAASSAT